MAGQSPAGQHFLLCPCKHYKTWKEHVPGFSWKKAAAYFTWPNRNLAVLCGRLDMTKLLPPWKHSWGARPRWTWAARCWAPAFMPRPHMRAWYPHWGCVKEKMETGWSLRGRWIWSLWLWKPLKLRRGKLKLLMSQNLLELWCSLDTGFNKVGQRYS